MEEILEYAHNTETPILSYNNETELSAIINLVYLSARDKYRVEREDKAGKGFVDYIFYPENKKDPGIILELKVDHSPREALKQIVDKDYKLKFQGTIGEIKHISCQYGFVATGARKERKFNPALGGGALLDIGI